MCTLEGVRTFLHVRGTLHDWYSKIVMRFASADLRPFATIVPRIEILHLDAALKSGAEPKFK